MQGDAQDPFPPSLLVYMCLHRSKTLEREISVEDHSVNQVSLYTQPMLDSLQIYQGTVKPQLFLIQSLMPSMTVAILVLCHTQIKYYSKCMVGGWLYFTLDYVTTSDYTNLQVP